MLQLLDLALFLALEQPQPAVQVIGQHHQLKMHAVHAPAPRRMGRQPGIVVSFLNEVLRPSPLVIEPHQQVNGILQVGHEHSVAVLGTIEQLILLAFGLALLLLIAQGNKAVRLAPALGLIPELTLLVSIGLGGWPPVRLLQLLQQTWRLARHDDEGSFRFLIGCDCLPAIEASVGTSENVGDARRQSGENTLQVTRDLLPTRSVSIAQIRPRYTRGFPPRRSEWVDNSSCPCSWDCRICARPSGGRRACARWCRYPA